MANERKTEKIVRTHFEKCEQDEIFKIKIEEQSSDNLKIQKNLQTASKKGEGIGRPDFIISFTDDDNFLIVIECKAEIARHKSESGGQYADFAVDCTLLYASHLSKDYDVLGNSRQRRNAGGT